MGEDSHFVTDNEGAKDTSEFQGWQESLLHTIFARYKHVSNDDL